MRLLLWGIAGIVAFFIAVQLVPYGRDHTNPQGNVEPKWDTTQTRGLAVRACFDCHSNQTTWPWYSNVAPTSWLIQRDVERGRRSLNFSAMDRPVGEARGAAREVQRGTMPPSYYVITHPAASLSATEKTALIQGLQNTLGVGGPGGGEGEGEGERGRRD